MGGVRSVAMDEPRTAKHKLSQLRFDWVSVVDRPDNPEAQVVLLKRDPTPDKPDSTVAGMPKPNEPVTKADGDDAQPEGAAIELPDEVVAYIQDLEAYTDELEQQLESVTKAATEDPGDDDPDEGDDGDDGDDDDEKVAKSVPAGLDEILKASPEIAQLLKRQAEMIKGLKDDAANAVALAEHEREARLTAEFNKRAGSFQHLNVDGDFLKQVAEACGTDLYTDLEKRMVGWDTQIGSADGFREIGKAHDGTPPSDDDDPLMALLAKSKEQTAGDSRTAEQRAVDAMAADPSLYDRWVSQRLIQNGSVR